MANHTSSDHPWFQAAVASPAGSVERGRYLFRDGRGPNGDLPPNDWQSVFGGPAWTRAPEPDEPGSEGRTGRTDPDGQWYLHLFAPEQPDLDWTNVEVRLEFESVLRFWLDRGVDGFRIDVANGLAKDPAMPDIAGRFAAGGLAAVGHPHWDQDAVHDIYRSWRRLSDAYPDERMFVAEAYLDSPERLARYVRPDELHTAFNFRFLLAPWDAAALREAIDRSIDTLADVGAPPTWVLSNHDVARHVTRYGGGPLGTRRARAAVMLMLALPGSAYLYQGEELGLPEVTDLPDDALAGPDVPSIGGHRPGPGRLPGADSVVGAPAVVRVRPGPTILVAPAGCVGRSRPPGTGGRPGLDAHAVPDGARDPEGPRTRHGRHELDRRVGGWVGPGRRHGRPVGLPTGRSRLCDQPGIGGRRAVGARTGRSRRPSGERSAGASDDRSPGHLDLVPGAVTART